MASEVLQARVQKHMDRYLMCALKTAALHLLGRELLMVWKLHASGREWSAVGESQRQLGVHAWLQDALHLTKELLQCEVGSTPGGRSIQEWVMPPELVDWTGIILGPDMQSHLEE